MKEKSELLMQIEELDEVKEQVRALFTIRTICDILMSYSYYLFMANSLTILLFIILSINQMSSFVTVFTVVKG